MVAKSHILLVDDDAVLREIAETALMDEGYSVVTAGNGREAVQCLSDDSKFDLVVTDLEMPEMDGLELIRKLRSSERYENLPVLLVTGKDQAVAVDEAFEAGATSFLSKPLNWTLFSRSVRFLLKAAKTESDLRHARDEAESASQLKQSLLSNMSHEMRTPLNHIVGFGELLQSQVAEDQKEFATYVVSGGRRLLSTVDDILFLSVAETDGVEADLDDSDLPSVFQALEERFADLAKAKKITLRQVNGNALPEFQADMRLVQQAFGKLVDNAIKFGPEGSQVAYGAMVHGDNGAGQIILFVKDEGPGMDEKVLPHLGREAFNQGEMDWGRGYEGMGAGLRIAWLIAEAHGGRLHLANDPDGGFKAAIVLPLKQQSKFKRSA